MEWVWWFADQIAGSSAMFLTLIALVAGNTILGAFLAFKFGVFDWAQFANFYRTDVIPKLGGFLVVKMIAGLAAPEFLGPGLGGAIADGIVGAAWLAVVAAIGGDILSKLADLGISWAEKVPGIVPMYAEMSRLEAAIESAVEAEFNPAPVDPRTNEPVPWERKTT